MGLAKTSVARWVLLILMGGVAVAQSGEEFPTPEISRFEAVEGVSRVGYVMRGQLGDTGHYVGLALACGTDGSGEPEITVFFGGFPHTHSRFNWRCGTPKAGWSASGGPCRPVRNRVFTVRS